MNIIEKNINSGYDRGFTLWHSHKSYELEDTIIKITDSVGGCGLQQLYGWLDCENDKEINTLIEYILDNLEDGTSCLICQVGCDFYNTELTKSLENNGFVISAEYINLQHCGNDTQRLYMYIPENAKINE